MTRRALVTAVLALVGVIGVVGLRVTGSDDPVAPSAPAEAAPAIAEEVAVDPAQRAVDEVVVELRSFVEATRGLAFTEDVDARLLDDEAFDALLAERGEVEETSASDLRRRERILKALGLVTPDFDLVRAASDPMRGSDGILGLYDHVDDVLYVRGASITPLVKSVLVHELVHALDDQHFDLTPYADADGELEENLAARALVEGNARRVEEAYVEQLPADERASVEQARGMIGLEPAPVDAFQTIDYFSLFPYLDGARFVKAIAEAGGERGVDAAYRRPPRTTAEVLEPERYLAGIAGTRLTSPASPSPPVDTGMFGELGLFLLVVDAVGPEKAAIAASTWEGDAYVAYEEGDRMCARVRFWLDGVFQSEVTARILEEWVAQRPGTTLDEAGTLVVTTCR